MYVIYIVYIEINFATGNDMYNTSFGKVKRIIELNAKC